MLNKKVLYLPKENKATAIKFERHLAQNIVFVANGENYGVETFKQIFHHLFLILLPVVAGTGLSLVKISIL
ncbi:MAG: hypothetical protein ABI358_01190 [Ginsengibacter sp.]